MTLRGLSWKAMLVACVVLIGCGKENSPASVGLGAGPTFIDGSYYTPDNTPTSPIVVIKTEPQRQRIRFLGWCEGYAFAKDLDAQPSLTVRIEHGACRFQIQSQGNQLLVFPDEGRDRAFTLRSLDLNRLGGELFHRYDRSAERDPELQEHNRRIIARFFESVFGYPLDDGDPKR